MAGGSRPDPFSYSKVVIVAHSLGAVVVRRALLFAAQQAQPWLPLVKMVLFAPAHNGAFAAVLAQSFLSGGSEWFLGKIATNLALLKMPLVQELDPASQVISDLRDDTKAELSRLDAGSLPGHLVAERVVWAGDECVVVCNSFGKDPVPMLFKGRHHVNVCKPEHGFLKPLDVVLQAL